MSAAEMVLSPGITRWSHEIRPHLNAAVENIVLAGKKLNQAKAELPHGQFGPLLDDLGLSRQMANRFMRVANNSVIANRSPVGALPASVSVLDVLTQLDDDRFETAIADGEIGPSTTRQQAKQLVARIRTSEAAAPDQRCPDACVPIVATHGTCMICGHTAPNYSLDYEAGWALCNSCVSETLRETCRRIDEVIEAEERQLLRGLVGMLGGAS